MLNWIHSEWAKTESWVQSWFPGFKTYFVNGLGAVGSLAALGQEYVTGLPTTKYISAETLALISTGLFTLSFWFHGLGDRVDARKAAI